MIWAASTTSGVGCDHTSVGVLIRAPHGLLVFERATAPPGIAPVAGHIDRHGSAEQAAHKEVGEEVGLTITDLHLLLEQWRPNRCRRTSTEPVGHQWWIFQARVSGSLRPSSREVREPRWESFDRLQQLALRTAALAEGRLSSLEFAQEPGLEPVWCRFLDALGVIAVPTAALDRIDTLL